MIEFSTIETLIMAYAPLLVTIIGIIVAFLKMVNIFKQLKKDTNKSDEEKTAEIKELKNNMQGLLDQNVCLKNQLNELLTKLDHIERKWAYDERNKTL